MFRTISTRGIEVYQSKGGILGTIRSVGGHYEVIHQPHWPWNPIEKTAPDTRFQFASLSEAAAWLESQPGPNPLHCKEGCVFATVISRAWVEPCERPIAMVTTPEPFGPYGLGLIVPDSNFGLFDRPTVALLQNDHQLIGFLQEDRRRAFVSTGRNEFIRFAAASGGIRASFTMAVDYALSHQRLQQHRVSSHIHIQWMATQRSRIDRIRALLGTHDCPM